MQTPKIVVCGVIVFLFLMFLGFFVSTGIRQGIINLAPVPNTVIAAHEGDLKLLRTLKSNGMSLDFQYPHFWDWTPLMAAIESGNSDVIQYLLTQNINLNAQDRNGRTALMWAISQHDTNTIVKLLERGAAVAIKDKMGATALSYARASSSPCVIRLIEASDHNPTNIPK